MENTISFEKLEKEIRDIYFSACRKELMSILNEIDDFIYENIDKTVFSCLTKEEKTFHTHFGTMRIARRLYKIGLPTGEVSFAYLLDEVLSGETYGHCTKAIAELICEHRDKKETYAQICKYLKDYHDVHVTRPALSYMCKNYHDRIVSGR